jgi:hypothetical protein
MQVAQWRNKKFKRMSIKRGVIRNKFKNIWGGLSSKNLRASQGGSTNKKIKNIMRSLNNKKLESAS